MKNENETKISTLEGRGIFSLVSINNLIKIEAVFYPMEIGLCMTDNIFGCNIDTTSDNNIPRYLKGIPKYIFSNKCDKIVGHCDSGYFINSNNIHCVNTHELKCADFPVTSFRKRIKIDIDLIRNMYKKFIEYDSTIIIENRDNKFKIFYDNKSKNSNKMIYSDAYCSRLLDYHVKIPLKWVKDILPLMSLIVDCYFYMKSDFPLAIIISGISSIFTNFLF